MDIEIGPGTWLAPVESHDAATDPADGPSSFEKQQAMFPRLLDHRPGGL